MVGCLCTYSQQPLRQSCISRQQIFLMTAGSVTFDTELNLYQMNTYSEANLQVVVPLHLIFPVLPCHVSHLQQMSCPVQSLVPRKIYWLENLFLFYEDFFCKESSCQHCLYFHLLPAGSVK